MKFITGTKGTFGFSSPYDNMIPDNLLLEVIGSYTLQDLIDLGLEPMVTIYEPAGLSEDDYNDDVRDGVTITCLYDGDGKLYVPDDRILTTVNISGIPYVNRTLGFNLGSLPESLPLNVLLTDIQEFIKGRLGIVPTTKLITSKKKSMILPDDDTNLKAAREIVKSDPNNLLTRLTISENRLEESLLEIEKLKSAIALLL